MGPTRPRWEQGRTGDIITRVNRCGCEGGIDCLICDTKIGKGGGHLVCKDCGGALCISHKEAELFIHVALETTERRVQKIGLSKRRRATSIQKADYLGHRAEWVRQDQLGRGGAQSEGYARRIRV